MTSYLSKERVDAVLSWLASASTEDRYKLAYGWNWDSGNDVLRWIVSQDNCDKSTALLIFWRASPEYYWSGPSDKAGWKASSEFFSESDYDLLVYIVKRWKADGFEEPVIAYDPRRDWKAGPSDVEVSARHPALAIREDMIQPTSGKVVPGRELLEGLNEGIPYEIDLATSQFAVVYKQGCLPLKPWTRNTSSEE